MTATTAPGPARRASSFANATVGTAFGLARPYLMSPSRSPFAIIESPPTTTAAFAIRSGVTLIPFRRPPPLFRRIEYRLRRGAAEQRAFREPPDFRRRRTPRARKVLALAAALLFRHAFFPAATRVGFFGSPFFRATPVAGRV